MFSIFLWLFIFGYRELAVVTQNPGFREIKTGQTKWGRHCAFFEECVNLFQRGVFLFFKRKSAQDSSFLDWNLVESFTRNLLTQTRNRFVFKLRFYFIMPDGIVMFHLFRLLTASVFLIVMWNKCALQTLFGYRVNMKIFF